MPSNNTGKGLRSPSFRNDAIFKRIAIIAQSAIVALIGVGIGNPSQALVAGTGAAGHGPFYFWRGIDMRPVAANGRRNTAGMIVERIQPGSPAAHAGLWRGNGITGIDGASVDGAATCDGHCRPLLWAEGDAESAARSSPACHSIAPKPINLAD